MKTNMSNLDCLIRAGIGLIILSVDFGLKSDWGVPGFFHC
jgi:hypothetical protein